MLKMPGWSDNSNRGWGGGGQVFLEEQFIRNTTGKAGNILFIIFF